MLNRSQWICKDHYLPITLLGITVIGAASAFPLSYVTATNVLIGVVLIPSTIFIQGSTRFNFIYFFGLIFFGIMAYAYQVKIFYFFAIALYLIFLLELIFGQINTLLLFLILLTSPVFLQLSSILGFPIRLHLSKWAGSVLSFAGLPIHVEGNMMVLNSFDFTVDEACMGLNMLAISMLMGVFLLSYQYKVTKLKLALTHLIFYFLIIFILNVISNLFRIITLVAFKILPGNPLHEIIGVLGLALYVMAPLYFLGKLMIQHFGKSFQRPIENNAFVVKRSTKFILTSLAFLIFLAGFNINPRTSESENVHANIELNNMQQVKMDGGITKLFNENLLVYIKPIPEFFSGEHTPLLCWKGSGYQFKSIKREFVVDREIYCGILVKGDAVLHTAWWYTNGKINTIDQFTWRSTMLRENKRFCLINITTKDKATLVQTLTTVFKNNLLNIR